MARKTKVPLLTARMRSHKSSQAVVNTRFYLIFGSLVIAAAAGLLASFAWMTNSTPQPDLMKAQPKGKAIAELTASAVLAGRPLNVPMAKTVFSSEEGIRVGSGLPMPVVDLVWSGFSKDQIQNIPYEFHSFEVVSSIDPKNVLAGTVRYTLIVVVLVPENQTPMLGALPYFTLPTESGERIAFDYGGNQFVSKVPASVNSRLEDWASYYASDDRDRLQSTTPDGRTEVEYKGLGGFTSSGVSILGALPQQSGPWLLRIRVQLVGANGFNTEVDMDITIDGVNQAAPQIVAWGPAGSGVLAIGHNSIIKN